MDSITSANIEKMILIVRGKKVMIDSDLASLYEVETKALNRAVRRNTDRFPEDFMFQLTEEEFEILRYQSGTLRIEHGRHKSSMLRMRSQFFGRFKRALSPARPTNSTRSFRTS